MLGGLFSTQFFVDPVDPVPGQTGDSVATGSSDTQPKRAPWLLCACFHYFQVNAEALLKVACFHYSFLLTGVTGSMTGCSGPFAMLGS